MDDTEVTAAPATDRSAPGVPLARPSPLTAWLAAARPKTLPLAVAPVFAGIGLAMAQTGNLAPWTALGTLLAAAAIQIGTNLHNDAADFERGADTPDRVGPPRATAQGWFTAAQVRAAAHLAFAAALVIGLLLAVRGGLPILFVGIASLIAGYAYTSGRRPIAYGPFGEVFVLVFFGMIAVAGSHYLQTLAADPRAVVLGAALGMPAAAVLLINNYRDLETDRAAGRRTLVHHLGRGTARWLYAVLLILPVPLLLAADMPGLTWLTLAALPVAYVLIRTLFGGATGGALNGLLARTALYQALLVALLLAGFVLGGQG